MRGEIKVESAYGVEYTFIKHLPIIGIERVYDFTLGIFSLSWQISSTMS